MRPSPQAHPSRFQRPMARVTITVEEAAEFSNIEEPRRSEIMTQATAESVVAIQLEKRPSRLHHLQRRQFSISSG